MKPIYPIFAIVQFIVLVMNPALAQPVILEDFENWHVIPNAFGAMDPDSFTSTNLKTSAANRKAISRSTDAYHGQYALQLSPLIAPDSSTYLTSAIVNGIAFCDETNAYKLYLDQGGLPRRSGSPTIFGYYKFIPDSGATADSAFVYVGAKKYNFNQDTVDVCTDYFYLAPVNQYTSFSFRAFCPSIVYDTVIVAFLYTSNNTSFFPKGKLLIDYISSQKNTGVADISMDANWKILTKQEQRLLSITAPPKHEGAELYILDNQGRLVHQATVQNQYEYPFSTAGIYYCRLLNKQGLLLAQQKLVVY